MERLWWVPGMQPRSPHYSWAQRNNMNLTLFVLPEEKVPIAPLSWGHWGSWAAGQWCPLCLPSPELPVLEAELVVIHMIK